jgi:hypothetical protein
MSSLADKIRKQLKAGKKPKEIAAMLRTGEAYVWVIRQRTTAEGFPRLTPADLAWELNRRQLLHHKEYHRQKSKEQYCRRKAAKENGDA